LGIFGTCENGVFISLLTLPCLLPAFPTTSLSFIPAISSDIQVQQLLNPLTVSSGMIHCHDLDSQAQQIHSGVLHFPSFDKIYFPVMSQSEYSCFK
jgi:hypothetical protein